MMAAVSPFGPAPMMTASTLAMITRLVRPAGVWRAGGPGDDRAHAFHDH